MLACAVYEENDQEEKKSSSDGNADYSPSLMSEPGCRFLEMSDMKKG